ncbi:hypothetical protein [Salicola sp. Rm-C-2C1-2]|uniref:hypothetical protein n=1 Tax=Salicola sp. Rm-C-2C1-2 TaxID=3141321 RepID=UPI0032E3A468
MELLVVCLDRSEANPARQPAKRVRISIADTRDRTQQQALRTARRDQMQQEETVGDA